VERRRLFCGASKNVWKDNRLWYGICHDEFTSQEGFWGELEDPYEPNRKTAYFLGHTKRQVIPRSLSWTLNFSVMEHR